VKASQLRRSALSLPEAEEIETWGEATFRVRNKMFCILGSDGRRASMKATLEQQAELIATRPDVFAVARYVGRHGWVAVEVARADAGEIAELLEDAWRLTAPKALVKLRDAAD
jgi:hypothetical protein